MFNPNRVNGANYNQTLPYSQITSIPITQIPLTQQSTAMTQPRIPDVNSFSDSSSQHSARQILHHPLSSSHTTSKRKNRQAFSQVEDERLRELVQIYGETNWTVISQKMANRNPRQCRDRWRCYLRPTLVKSQWTDEEDRLLIKKYNEIGPKWSIIGKSLPGRSEITMKNRWKLLSKTMMMPVNSNIPIQPVIIPASIPATPAITTPPPTINLAANPVNDSNIYFLPQYGQQQQQIPTPQPIPTIQPIATPTYLQPSIPITPIAPYPIQPIKIQSAISTPITSYSSILPTNPYQPPISTPTSSDSVYSSSDSSAYSSTSASDPMQSTILKEVKVTNFIQNSLTNENGNADQISHHKSSKIHIISKTHPVKLHILSNDQFSAKDESNFQKKSTDSSPDTSSADGELANNGIGIPSRMNMGIDNNPQAAASQNIDAFLDSISNGPNIRRNLPL